jgi:hypothetical protein
MKLAILLVKFSLVAGGTLIAGSAAFFTDGSAIWKDPSTWSNSQVWGIVGSVLVFLGVIFLLLTEEESGAAYDAHEALTRADELKFDLEETRQLLASYESASKRMASLYLAYSAARGVLEQAAISQVSNEKKLIEDCLWSMKQDLQISLGLKMRHTWTICVYQRLFDETDQYNYLHCVADSRSIPCNLADARRWKEGVGVGGIALAKDGEVVTPDILAEGTGSLFKLDGDIVKREDLARYRSMMAVPISVDGDPKPWGVVLVSCDEPYHFGAGDGGRVHTGLKPEEAVRTLAAVAALAIAICRCSTTSLENSSGGTKKIVAS